MIIDALRRLNHAEPFRPYVIRMASGERYKVPHPDFIAVSPRGSEIIVYDETDRGHILSPLLLEAATPLNGRGLRRSKRRSR